MLEELCKEAFFKACEKEAGYNLWLKQRGVKVNQFYDFFENKNKPDIDWNFIPIQKISRQKRDSLYRQAFVWFNEKAEDICYSYVKSVLGGNLQAEMERCCSFQNLFDAFRVYFEERKQERMSNDSKELQIKINELSQKGKKPQSHGGVANLLKVLTQTMTKQGSSVHSIAKVQYAVCMQAGIMIPDEFLLDVLTASDIIEAK